MDFNFRTNSQKKSRMCRLILGDVWKAWSRATLFYKNQSPNLYNKKAYLKFASDSPMPEQTQVHLLMVLHLTRKHNLASR